MSAAQEIVQEATIYRLPQDRNPVSSLLSKQEDLSKVHPIQQETSDPKVSPREEQDSLSRVSKEHEQCSDTMSKWQQEVGCDTVDKMREKPQRSGANVKSFHRQKYGYNDEGREAQTKLSTVIENITSCWP